MQLLDEYFRRASEVVKTSFVQSRGFDLLANQLKGHSVSTELYSALFSIALGGTVSLSAARLVEGRGVRVCWGPLMSFFLLAQACPQCTPRPDQLPDGVACASAGLPHSHCAPASALPACTCHSAPGGHPELIGGEKHGYLLSFPSLHLIRCTASQGKCQRSFQTTRECRPWSTWWSLPAQQN